MLTCACCLLGMGVTVWWQLYHLQHLKNVLPTSLSSALQIKVGAYAHFVQQVMLPNGAVPAFFQSDGSVFNCGAREDEGGCISATSAISGTKSPRTSVLVTLGRLVCSI